ILPTTWQIFDDVRAAIDWVHGAGALKTRVMANPDRYLRRDPEVALALLRLALGGRRLILLTNSDWIYASSVCSYLFDDLLPGLASWKQLFDLVLVEAGKPAFFRTKRPFEKLDAQGHTVAQTAVPEWGGTYSLGSLEGLMRLIDEPGEHVLYVGDHIYGDIVSSKIESTWRTTLIVRELEDEISQRMQLQTELQKGRELRRDLANLGHEMDHLRDVVRLYQHQLNQGRDIPGEPLEAMQRRAERITERHRKTLRSEADWADQIGSKFSSYWGSFFKQGTSKTRFAAQLETYACLYTSRVSNFAYYGSKRYFRVAQDPMMHELDIGLTE
ncbi:MAG: 5'-nucleotidase domain-containing protein, partial [Acidobacteriota bacterium]